MTRGSMTFLQTGIPTWSQATLRSHIPRPHISLGEEGDPLTLSRPLPCEHSAEGWGPSGPPGPRGSVAWAR